MSELAYLSAVDALARFRALEVSPAEVLEALIDRAAAVEPHINAFTDTFFDTALPRARAAADAYAAGTARPLEGLAVAVKDEDWIAGQRTPNGSLLFADFVPEITSPVSRRILDAGGIVHARAAAPEFSMTVVTWSLLNGVTRNPWNLALTPGGSSGGSGAALAAGSTTLATGSDIGGSIRIPASMNGVVGFKPPFGRVPEMPPWNREPFLASGPLARTVADAILLQNVMSGPRPGDLWSLRRLDLPARFPSLDGMRIALSPDLGYFGVDAGTVAALEDAAGRLRDLGATVEPVELPWEHGLMDAVEDHLSFQMGTVMRRELPSGWEDRVTSYVRDFFERPEVSVERWIAAWERIDTAYGEFETVTFSAGFDAVICPTLTTTDVPADWGHPDTGESVPLGEALEVAMTYPFNALGRLPVLDVPIGIDARTGVPIGMQIVGPIERDEIPFGVGAALEAADGPLFERERPQLGMPG